ncbi:aldo/keto reductase [Allosediminivita pacifica]|uniref:Aldo/keto reductase family protein n=1 Tax=Allosediminivita pacifica TaxID=1267769 RepID=A0A2T6A8Z5_9RHOB|nr:aldo/keto reductase [Allosediminivita pacifica]PTX40291.1 aldo/keto reductase family protein [Allosediminivita pacifica]
MPLFGLGVYQSSLSDTVLPVRAALDEGCRLIDSTCSDGNKAVVGLALRKSGLDRGEVFVTTKLEPASYGPEAALTAFELSMSKLKIQVLDLYPLHWPVPLHFAITCAAWKVSEGLLRDGRVQAPRSLQFHAGAACVG